MEEYLKPRKSISSNTDNKHLIEVGGSCPLCGKRLLQDKIASNKKTRTIKLYEIAHIFPNKPTDKEKKLLLDVKRLGNNCEDFENKIALCKDCHSKYDTEKTIEEYNNLVSIKEQLLRQAKANEDLDKQTICESIRNIFSQLKMIDGNIEELKLNALEINKKIEDKNHLLKNKVSMYISTYFNFIKEYFRNNQKSIDFDLIASHIKSAFCAANKNLNNQSDIFNQLRKWLEKKCSGFETEAYEAVISYFIQDCEVFNEISK